MPDELDDLLRAAMKTLDEQVPSGYFEALPNHTLARLEGSSMQQGPSGMTTQTRDARIPAAPSVAPAASPPPPAVEEDREDSGLHDIRNLAQSTKQRLSSKRVTANPTFNDDDVIASSSGSWKNMTALPQPAAMVSLPALAELPRQEITSASKKAAKAEAKAEAKLAKAAAIEAPAAEAPVAAPSVSRFTLPSQQRKSKGPVIAILGLGLAAAAGAVIFMQVNKTNDEAASAAAPASETTAKAQAEAVTATPTASGSAAPAAAAVVTPIEPPPEAAKADEGAAGAAQIAADNVEDAQKATDAKADKDAPAKGKATKGKPSKGGKKVQDAETQPVEKVEVKPAETKPEVKKPVAKGEDQDPSFDALLKEAGVSEKKEVKPKLSKTALSGDDFKKGMSAIAGKAKGCYKGTQGTATVKLTVSPSGQVSKVTVGGEFAGKPEATCVEAAVKGASFPPWDGGPQSFNYSYMLSD